MCQGILSGLINSCSNFYRRISMIYTGFEYFTIFTSNSIMLQTNNQKIDLLNKEHEKSILG